MLQDLSVFTRAARTTFRGNVTGALVALTLGLGSWSMATAGAPTEVGTGSGMLYAGDVGWNGAKPGAAS
ncbi:hypothetical protein [Streptomyces sp. NPDC002889]|uniref:hypothetical protein n=1 Tax=Streptomyces sp. NPDC002889 TaxID=3364669 RepID=UPI0036AC2F88